MSLWNVDAKDVTQSTYALVAQKHCKTQPVLDKYTVRKKQPEGEYKTWGNKSLPLFFFFFFF